MSGGEEPERPFAEELIHRLVQAARCGQRVEPDRGPKIVEPLSHVRERAGLKLAFRDDQLGFDVVRHWNRCIEAGILVGKPRLGVVVRGNSGIALNPDVSGGDVR